jgi:hypothetical protein
MRVSRRLLSWLIPVLIGCGDGTSTAPPPAPTVVEGRWSPQLRQLLPAVDGVWDWGWDDGAAHGAATLTVRDAVWRWTLHPGSGGAPPGPALRLDPGEPLVWHTMAVPDDPASPGRWLPLPRRALASPHHLDLLQLLRELTRAAFGERATGWGTTPVPVHAGAAVSGAVDLRAELRAAVEQWNAASPRPLFRWTDADSGGGVYLVHLAGRRLSPRMSAYLVRRDTKQDVLRLHIRVGDDYDTAQLARYARRAFLHELAHALLLWGHTACRDHVLWRSGPIVDVPSSDEVTAALWLDALPRGLLLSRYGGSAELDP